MQPIVEVFSPEKPRLMLSGKKRRGWVDPSPPPVAGPEEVLSLVAPCKPGRKSRDITPERQELIQRAFETYRDMGEERSLAKVSETLNLPARNVRHWCLKFKWQKKIALTTPSKISSVAERIQERVAQKIVQAVDRQVDLVNIRHSLMTVPDPADPSKELPTKELSSNSLKETGTVLLSAVKSLAEVLGLQKLKKEIESVGDSGGGKGNKTAVMVNVIFKG